NVWQWDSMYMFLHFGDRAALAVLINASLLTWLLRKQSILMQSAPESMDMRPVPLAISLVHIALLVGIVMFSHHASVFIALFLIFLGFTQAFAGYQNRLILREAMLVALFLAGLVILGGQQQWWLQPIVESLQPKQLFFSTAALTAVTDNAALTYLGSLISNISQEAKYALLAGAVAGGGLTVIANAPNPAGVAILRKGFTDEAISALQLLLVAIIPTAVAVVCFLL
ncbi:MAG: putative Na+/H+ antiporter, partial [Methylophilaceae bacterium]